ncbi:MAG: zf-HC2 domain-containing protein [Myxococcota bacterium]|nr:zf-HC2 domain-containing protein [Myxococcota bacterium]
MNCVDCNEFRSFIDPYLDREFDEQERALFDAHLATCASCRAYYEHHSSFLKVMKPALKRPCKMPENARSRLEQKLKGAKGSKRVGAVAMTVAKPASVVAAAALLFIFVAPLTGFSSSVVEDVVDQHVQTMPVEVPSPEATEVNRWFSDKLPFRMLTPQFKDQRVTLLGGRLSRVRATDQGGSLPAAHLLYRVGQHKMSVLVFDDRVKGRRQGPQNINADDMNPIMRDIRGHRVMIYRRDGLTYAITSTLPETDMKDVMGTSL